MNDIVLDLSAVGKRYATYASNFARFASWFSAGITPSSEFWALDDISFRVARGESIALIGQNGAGKSTLLKIISGIVRPTRGHLSVSGRISAILELGLGFNPEFTGRQNVFIAGGFMGFSQQELAGIAPVIEDFAELGEFFDQPLRTYSSGMQARLAFALATARRPDILIVDEVLSVGDSYFQHKSFDRIRQFKAAGTSIVLVSHALGDVRALCDRVILLEHGRILKDGLPDEVVDFYNAMIAARENAKPTVEQQRNKEGWLHTRSGSREAIVQSLELLDATTRAPVNTAIVGQKLVLKLLARVEKPIPSLVLGFMLRDRTGHVVWGTNTWHTRQVIEELNAGEVVAYELAFTCALGPGSYSFSPALTRGATHLEKNYEWQDNALVFDVLNTQPVIFIGTNWIDASFAITRQAALAS